VGQSSPRFHTVYAPHLPARNFGQLLVNTVDAKATIDVLRDSRKRLSGAFPEAHVRWKQLALQFGFPVEVRLSGDDIETLKKTAAQIEAHARTIPGTTWVHNDYEEALQTIEVVPDADACARLGVPPAMLQMSLALGSQGFPVATIWEGDYPVRVLVKDAPRDRASLEGLRQQVVSSMLAAATVPLEQIAAVRPAWNDGAIVRRNGVRTLTVFIDIGMDALGSAVQKQIEGFVAKHEPPGVRVEYGGERELTEEVFFPMTVSMGVSIGLIFLVILFQFQRFRKTLVVMLAMPLSLLGAFVGLTVMGYPFGVTSFLGVIGLMGIVVRNGIILVTYAEELRREQGLGAMEAALAAGKRRMRPIYLTSMAAAVGVVPMILSRSTLWGPLATVTCFGLLVAMVLTLFVLPVAYGLVMRSEDRRGAGGENGVGGGGAKAAKTAALVGLVLLGVLQPSAAQAQQGPLTLAQAQALALRRNAQIQESKLEIEAAEETRKATYTKYFPPVSATAVGMVALKPLVEISTQGGNLPIYDGNPANLATATQFAYMPAGSMALADRAFVGALTAIQPVYVGGRVVNGNRLAALGVKVAKDKSELSERDALAQTEEKYWRLVALREKLRTLAAYESLLSSLDTQVSDAVSAGLLTRNDQLKVRLKRAEAGVDRQRLEGGLRLSARDLRRHIGLPRGDSLALADALAAPDNPAALRQQRPGALERRPELRLLSSAVRAEQLQTSLKRGEMLPTVSVGASLLRMDVQGMPGSTNGLVFGLVNVPLSGIWEGVHATASQRKRAELAEKRLSSTRELIGLEIEKTWTDLEAAWHAVQVSDSAVEQAEVNVSEVSDRHKSGLVTFSDVLEAQVLRQQTFDRRIDARVDYWLKRSAFLRSIARDRR
jgi:outer membrane protein TolC/preprotein translocase subunit SecF